MEGEGEPIPKAKYGYSGDQRFDCKPVIVALVATRAGFPLAYEVMEGNRSDRTTLRDFLDQMEKPYGQARRVWVMDRGIPTEAVLQEMRNREREVYYLVGTPRSKVQPYEKKWLELPWKKVREPVEVKRFADHGEWYVLAKSEGRQAQERAMRRKRLARLLRKLRVMHKSLPLRDQLLLRMGAAKKEAGRAFGFVELRVPEEAEPVTREAFPFQVNQEKLRRLSCAMATICCDRIWWRKIRRCCGNGMSN